MNFKGIQSKLDNHEEFIRKSRSNGWSYRKIAYELNNTYGLNVAHNTIFSFVKTRSKKRKVITMCEGRTPEPSKDSFSKMMSNPKSPKKEPESKEGFVFDFNPDEPIY